MKKPSSGKVQFGICESCFQHLSAKGDLLTETFLDACVYHVNTKCVVPLHILEDRYPISIGHILRELEIEKYIISHETKQGLYILPLVSRKHNSLPIYCSNRFLGCSKVFLEQKINE